MDTEKEVLIREAIHYGALDFCLDNKFCTKEDVLFVFSKIKSTNIHVMSSYVYFCKQLPIQDQYFDDGSFILLKNPNLMYVALYIKGAQSLPLEKGSTVTFFQHFKNKEYYVKQSRAYRNIAVNNYDPHTMTSTQVSGLLTARHEFLFETYEYDITKVYIYNDWFEKIPKNHCTIALIVNRLEKLSNTTTFYYDAILPFYQKILEDCFSDEKCLSVYSFSRNIIRDIQENMPNFKFPFSVEEKDLLDIFFTTLNPYVAGYYLGMPIHKIEPTKEMILQCIFLLKKVGLKEYAEFITDKTKKMLTKKCWYHSEDVTLLNERDVYDYEITSYCPFDIVFLRNKEHHVHGFTRNELPYLIKTKKNLYTNEKIPADSIYAFWLRSKYTEYYTLPEAKPYSELLRSIEEHPFFTFSVEDVIRRNKQIELEETKTILLNATDDRFESTSISSADFINFVMNR